MNGVHFFGFDCGFRVWVVLFLDLGKHLYVVNEFSLINKYFDWEQGVGAKFLSSVILQSANFSLIITSTGASAMLMFGSPHVLVSRLWNLIGGHGGFNYNRRCLLLFNHQYFVNHFNSLILLTTAIAIATFRDINPFEDCL